MYNKRPTRGGITGHLKEPGKGSNGSSWKPRQRGALPSLSQEQHLNGHQHWSPSHPSVQEPRQGHALPPLLHIPTSMQLQPVKLEQEDITNMSLAEQGPSMGALCELPWSQHIRPKQRGAIVSPYVHYAPAKNHGKFFKPPENILQSSDASEKELTFSRVHVEGCAAALTLHEIKSSFMLMWNKLDETLQNNQSTFLQMQEDLEKSLHDIGEAKEAALRDREEIEANKAKALETFEIIKGQMEKIKHARGQLEHLSTDLSVQLVELNHIQRQLQEEQAAIMVKFQDRHVSQGRWENEGCEAGLSERDLWDCEVRLNSLEKELTKSRLASEKIEQAGLRGISDINEVINGMAPYMMLKTHTVPGPKTSRERECVSRMPSHRHTGLFSIRPSHSGIPEQGGRDSVSRMPSHHDTGIFIITPSHSGTPEQEECSNEKHAYDDYFVQLKSQEITNTISATPRQRIQVEEDGCDHLGERTRNSKVPKLSC